MHLPFTHTEFFDLLATFNRTFWPAIALLWLATAATAVSLARGRARPQRVLLLLTIHWLWSGVVFHAWYFTRINPRADLFAAMFVVQAMLFAWAALVNRVALDWEASFRQLTGLLFIALALAYPLLVLATGHRYPAAPAFGVPCPTTLFTVGVLLYARSQLPRLLLVVPLAWSLIGGSAVFVLGMTPDLLLLVGGVALLPLLMPARFRNLIDHWYTDDADATRPMQGDAVAPDPAWEMTLTRVAGARPEQIWPWLLQLGYHRGGLYSYDWLDRLFGVLDAPSAASLLPAFQRLEPGDVIPIGNGPGFPVRAVKPNRSLVLGGQVEDTRWSWEIALDPIDPSHTLITSRSRGIAPHTFGSRVFMAMLGPAAFLMTRRMLIGLAQRGEMLAHAG